MKRMRDSGLQQSLFFLGLPDPQNLVCVSLTLQDEDEEEPRSKQIKTCRELVMLYSDIMASPALDSFTEITVVMAIPFFQKGILQAFGQGRRLQLGSPQCVFPGDLQRCLSYSLVTRLSPNWNKAGLYLVSGKDFLTQSRRLNAISLQLSTTEGQLCISVDVDNIRLPPTTLQDLNLPSSVFMRFCSDSDGVVDSASMGGALWCHVLPSMKKGQIINISRQLPRDGPFKTYRDLQLHWKHLYGYRLPPLSDDEVVYCSVYFRPVGQRLFTYPLSCIRLQPPQRCPQVDQQEALDSFLSDVTDSFHSVCGFPARLSRKPCYHTTSLTAAGSPQVVNGENVNLTTWSSVRPVLTHLPPHPVIKPSLTSLPKPCASNSQQDAAQRILGNGCGSGRNQSQRVSFSSSSSFCSVFQPASSLTSSSSSVLPPPPPPPSVTPPPKLVPVFKINPSSRHVNVGGGERRRVSLPVFEKSKPTATTAAPPPPVVPGFVRPESRPRIKRLSSLSPASRSKPVIIFPARLDVKHKTSIKTDAPHPPHPDVTNKKPSDRRERRVAFELKPHKSRASGRDVDVERMARNNQLSNVKTSSLLSWLKGRGVVVGAKTKKDELMLKVMSCLAEA